MERTIIQAKSSTLLGESRIPNSCPSCAAFQEEIRSLKENVCNLSITVPSFQSMQQSSFYEEKFLSLKERFESLKQRLDDLESENEELCETNEKLRKQIQSLKNNEEKQFGKTMETVSGWKNKKEEGLVGNKEAVTNPEFLRDRIIENLQKQVKGLDSQIQYLQQYLNHREEIQERRHKKIKKLGLILHHFEE